MKNFIYQRLIQFLFQLRYFYYEFNLMFTYVLFFYFGEKYSGKNQS